MIVTRVMTSDAWMKVYIAGQVILLTRENVDLSAFFSLSTFDENYLISVIIILKFLLVSSINSQFRFLCLKTYQHSRII